MLESENYIIGGKVEWEQISEGIQRQILGYNDQIMMVKMEFLTGSEVHYHSHVHSQCSYIASGVFEFDIDGEQQVVTTGNGLYMGSNVSHGVKCLEAGVIIDSFSPVRLDFLK